MPSSDSFFQKATFGLHRQSDLTGFGWRLLLAEDRKLVLGNLKLISILAALLVPLFSLLDLFAHPEHIGFFVTLRLMCSLSIIGLYMLIRGRLGKKYYRLFTVALPLIPALFISAMIYILDDPGSPYYAGLNLCVVGIGFLFHWTFREAFVVSCSVLIMYLVACYEPLLAGVDVETAAGFFNNTLFLVVIGFVVTCGCIAHHRIRIEEFKGRENLRRKESYIRQKNAELVKTYDELRNTEDQLIQSEKMASLGQLSAGVIHEIGNPLNYSNQALFLLRRKLKKQDADEQMMDAVDDIQDSIDRMKDIVTELRDFSHKKGEVGIEFEVEDSIHIVLRMLGKEISESNVRIDLDIEPGLKIDAVKNQFTQVLINLIHNSVQALAELPEGKKRIVSISGYKRADRVVIKVRDNGPGISKEIQRNIFDPFFTTKEVGEGTGLGLSISFRIIESHKGTLTVDSEEGEFTEFTVNLPIEESAEPAKSIPFTNQQDQTHHGKAIC